MQLTLTQLDFTVSLNACHDQILHKMQVLTNMEIQLLRKFEHQLGNPQTHFEMIHDVRVTIVNLEQVYKDVKEYFNEMGIQFVYDFFRKIQVLMVCGYNFMSQALLVNVDRIQDKKIKQLSKAAVPDCKVCKCTCDNMTNKKRQIKQVQQFDYKISMLQNEQQKLTSQIQNIYQKMMIQKTMIEKTKPSLAIRELQDMKEHIENVMQSTNSIFEETYMMKYVEFKNYLSKIKKPQDIVDYFVSNMNFNMKDKFLKAMQKAIYKAQHMEENIEMKHVADAEIQTDKPKEPTDNAQYPYRGFSSLKPQKNTSLLTKERKFNQKMVAEIQFLKKQLNSLIKQNETFKAELQAKQAERKKSADNYDILQQLYNKRSFELDDAKNQNRWLASEKENQTKKLRHQIKELKKQQVQMISHQTQTYIAPNCLSVSTQTQIIYFQHEVDNQIINVLKKANQKMITSLNEKEKKLRELKVTSEQLFNLRQCKLSCMAFLHDLRQVTEYKIADLNKQLKNAIPDKITTFKQPIIPLNEFTTIKSVNITIDKLSQDIKKLLLSQPNKSKQNEKQRLSVRRLSQLSNKLSSKDQISSKVSQISCEKTGADFFKNVTQRRSSMIAGKSDIKNFFMLNEQKKSEYNNKFASVNYDEKKSTSQSSISQKNSQQASQQNKTSSNHRSASSGRRMSEVKIFENKYSLKSQIRRQFAFCQKESSQTITRQVKEPFQNSVCFSVQVQTDILRVQNQQRTSYINRNKNQSTKVTEYQNFVLYSEYSQQTDLTNQMITKLEQNNLSKPKQIQTPKTVLNETIKNGYQSNSNSKNQYMIRKPGKLQNQKIYTQESDRNYLSVNSCFPIDQAQISQNIHQHLNKTQNDQFVASNTSFANNLQPVNNLQPSQRSSLNNMTLQSRLSALLNPQNRKSFNSGLVIFKKPKNDYERRSAQVMSFDNLKMEKIQTKQNTRNQIRNISFNTQRGEASFNLQSENKNDWRQMISKIEEECEMDKENKLTSQEEMNSGNSIKANNKPHRQSNFVARISEDDDMLISKRSMKRQATLIDVSKKIPVEREHRISPKSYELPEKVFNRTVKHMLLTTQSRQTLMGKVQAVCQSLEKEKEQKRIKKTTKQIFTTRDSNQPQRHSSKKNTQLFKLAQILG